MVIERRKSNAGGPVPRRDSNRRAFPRWKAPYEVRYGVGKELQEGQPLEIGEGGLSFTGEKLYPLETELNVQYRLACDAQNDKAWVTVKAIVRHSEAGKLGVEFLNLMRADRLKIVDFITAAK